MPLRNKRGIVMDKVCISENLRSKLTDVVMDFKSNGKKYHEFRDMVIKLLVTHNWEISSKDCCSILEISKATFFIWKKKYGFKKNENNNKCTVLKYEEKNSSIKSENSIIEKNDSTEKEIHGFSRMFLPTGIIIDINNNLLTPEFIKGLLP